MKPALLVEVTYLTSTEDALPMPEALVYQFLLAFLQDSLNYWTLTLNNVA
ncbi:hypothetical protein RSO01_89190 [Reyranella soli]|uniref:Uncharacterized protein n=1 Tax=Reyranella soli TaxID=1230389 RepID=A0A512NS39_9HYPH|nr:hypothetical protein [Reyranella soli]GEP61753.1 hypothetical protein RSO01_89190 [Reyranella soli]